MKWSTMRQGVKIMICKNDPNYNGKLTNSAMIDARRWIKHIEQYDGTGLIIEKPHLSANYWSTDACREPNVPKPPKLVGI